jgi:hypothetical protein
VSDKVKIVMRMTRYAKSKEKCTVWEAPVRPVWSSQHTQLGGTGQTGAPDRPDRSGPVSAQSNKSACYLVQGDQARVASWLRSPFSI